MRISPVRLAMLAAAASLLGAAGCQTCEQLPSPTVEQVVADVNRNNELMPWFKARIESITLTVKDEAGLSWRIPADLYGYLLYTQPNMFVLRADKGGLTTVLEMGSNRKIFWMWAMGANRGWVGRQVDWPADEPSPLLIHPGQLVQLLGIDAIDRDLTRMPLVALRTNDCERAYVLEFVDLQRDHASLIRETWIDADSRLPRRVRLFDRNGRAALESDLAEWRRTTGSAGWFPHQITIRWLSQTTRGGDEDMTVRPGTTLRLDFSDVEVKEKFSNPAIYEPHPPADVPLQPLQRTTEPRMLATGEDR